MTSGHVFIAASLDGFIARPDGDIDWLEKHTVEGEDNGYSEMMASVDGLVMGSSTFRMVLTFGEWIYEKPVIVMSQSMNQSDVPDQLNGKVRVSNASPRELMEELEIDGWKRAYIDGGKIIQSFLSDGLIEDIILTRVPVILGSGLPLFGPSATDIDLKHLSTQTFPSGLVSSKYRVLKPVVPN